MSDSGDTYPTVARYLVTSRWRPMLTEAISVGHAMRLALLSQTPDPVPPVISGRGPDNQPLEGHQHLHIFAESLGEEGRISHLTVYAPMGFDEAAQQGLEAVQKIWHHSLDRDLECHLLGRGRPQDFAGSRAEAGHSLALYHDTIWESRTPFVPTRHGKRRNNGDKKRDEDGDWIGGPRHDLKRLLRAAGIDAPTTIETLEATKLGGNATTWDAFRTDRDGGGERSTRQGHGFRLTFKYRVCGPIALGYGAHFGLGRFWPAGRRS